MVSKIKIKTPRWLAPLLLTVAVLMAVAPGHTKKKAKGQRADGVLVGKWKARAMEAGGDKREVPYAMFIQFERGGKFSSWGETKGQKIRRDGRWTVSGRQVTTFTAPPAGKKGPRLSETMRFEVKGDTLVLAKDHGRNRLFLERAK